MPQHYEGDSTIVRLDQSIGSPILTNFYRTAARFTSPIINFVQYHQLFKSQLRIHQIPKLLFCASRDGFEEAEFRKHCEDQGKIVIIVKSKKGDIFGGYTTQSLRLDERGTNVKDEESFTFRFDDGQLYIFRLIQDDSIHALYRYNSTYLFAFGYCFWLCNNANIETLSSSHNATEDHILPECKLPQLENYNLNHEDAPSEKRQYYAGFNFLVEDFEVYKIID